MHLSDRWEKFISKIGYTQLNGLTKTDKIVIKLRVAVAKYNTDLYKLFKKYDRNQDNILDMKEFTLLIK